MNRAVDQPFGVPCAGAYPARERSLAAAGRVPLRVRVRRWLHWITWRHRYLGGFIVWGFLSIVLEVFLVSKVFPQSWPLTPRSILGFLYGMVFAFYMNARFNFKVSRKAFAYTFFLFTLVSVFSYTLNLTAARYLSVVFGGNYPASRLVTSGCLFLIAYSLHRRFTFRGTIRQIGLAVYAAAGEDIGKAYASVGDQCDHIHLDLVDETIAPDAAAVDVGRIAEARRLWSWQPFCLHLMSKTPLRWIESCWNSIDTVLVHVDIEDDVMEVIGRCRQKGCTVGVVWHHTVSLTELMPFLPHVDFVMVLGVEHPGRSGQPVMAEAIHAAGVFAGLASRYGYQLIFDGGVTTENVRQIPAPILVSCSSVLRAENPAKLIRNWAVLHLTTGESRGRY